MNQTLIENLPFWFDFAHKLPIGIEIESGNHANDCVTVNGDGSATGTDDD